MAKNILVEKWGQLIESPKAKKVVAKEQMAQLLENQEVYITEAANTIAGDVAQYTPILVPAVRRVFPNLLANEIVGIQPLSTPTGYAYALRYAYGKGAGISQSTDAKFDRFGAKIDTLTGTANKWGSRAIVIANYTGAIPAAGTVMTAAADGTTLATVRYTEGVAASLKVLVDLVTPVDINGANAFTGTSDAYKFGAAITGADLFQVVFETGNEAGYNLIFKNYFGPVTTATGEALKLSDGTMKTMKMSLERVAIEAQTKKLAAEYTIELAQDLKAIHGLDAEGELINILEYEITAELDRELLNVINTVATAVTPWSYKGYTEGATGATTGAADGRWEQERFRTLYTKIVREANMIALTSRRGAGNFIVASTNVVTALEALPNFMYSAVPGDVKPTFGVAKVGTLDGRFAVYMDTFAVADYVTVGYKGPSQFDTGVIYCPYVPLMLQKVTDPDTFQPKLGFMTRDAIAGNLFGAANYYRKFSVDLDGSSLIGGYGMIGASTQAAW